MPNRLTTEEEKLNHAIADPQPTELSSHTFEFVLRFSGAKTEPERNGRMANERGKARRAREAGKG